MGSEIFGNDNNDLVLVDNFEIDAMVMVWFGQFFKNIKKAFCNANPFPTHSMNKIHTFSLNIKSRWAPLENKSRRQAIWQVCLLTGFLWLWTSRRASNRFFSTHSINPNEFLNLVTSLLSYLNTVLFFYYFASPYPNVKFSTKQNISTKFLKICVTTGIYSNWRTWFYAK